MGIDMQSWNTGDKWMQVFTDFEVVDKVVPIQRQFPAFCYLS